MKIKKSIVVAAVALSLVACNKTTPPHVTSNSNENQQITSKELKQKMYSLSEEQCNKVVKNFKEFAKATNLQSRIESTSLQADSSIWILEAVLNSDFDQLSSSNLISQDSIGYSLTLDQNNTISNSDLNNAYSYFKNYINQQLTSNLKVKVIDISAITSNNTISYIANIIYFEDYLSTQKTQSPCDPYTTETARWSYSMTGTGCSGTTNDGPAMCNVKLNCVANNPCSGGSFYYSNVVTPSWSNAGNAYPSALYYKTNSFNLCPALLSASNLNGYITGCKSIGTSNIPTTPSGYVLVNYNVWPGFIGSTYFTMWWTLTVTYGIPVCNGGGGNG